MFCYQPTTVFAYFHIAYIRLCSFDFILTSFFSQVVLSLPVDFSEGLVRATCMTRPPPGDYNDFILFLLPLLVYVDEKYAIPY